MLKTSIISRWLEPTFRPEASVGFRLNRMEVLLQSNHQPVVNEVQRYLGPHFEILDPVKVNMEESKKWTIWVINDPAWTAPKLLDSKPMVIYNSDETPMLGRECFDEEGRLVIHNLLYDTLLVIDVKNRHGTVVGSIDRGILYPGPISCLAGSVYGVIRHILRNEVENAGAIVVHGSVVSIENIGLAFIGDKGTGKTTSLIALLRRRAGAYVANDRFFLWSDEKNIKVSGWPTTCRITLGTLALFEELYPLIPDKYRTKLLRAEIEDRVILKKKILLLPQDIGRLLNSSIQRITNLHILVLLESSSESISTFEECTPEYAETALRSNLFSPVDHQHPNWMRLMQQSLDHRQASCERTISELLRSVCLLRLRGHPGVQGLLNFIDTIFSRASLPPIIHTDKEDTNFEDVKLVSSSFGWIAVPHPNEISRDGMTG